MRRRGAGWSHEWRLHARGYRAVAGVDEVGRGCLAGPVVAGAVILDPLCPVRGLRDSKQIPRAPRAALARRIVRAARAFAFGLAGPEEIDRTDILRATLAAMRRAVRGLPVRPDYLLVDALVIPEAGVPQDGIVRGDATVASIAAASILAKVYRDEMMRAYHALYPAYGFDANAGYGTPAHLEALRAHGATAVHRTTFRGVRLEIDDTLLPGAGSH
jgi:ribonuclease HII